MTSAPKDHIASVPESEGEEERITLDDIKHRAQHVKDIAVIETKGAVGRVMSEDGTRMLLVAAGVVLVVASLAYFLGSRSGRRSFIDLD